MTDKNTEYETGLIGPLEDCELIYYLDFSAIQNTPQRKKALREMQTASRMSISELYAKSVTRELNHYEKRYLKIKLRQKSKK